ncbi:MAG: hypothetical protein AB1327_08650 [Bacillota bacterium]|uniref:hypothetical protein n=1 Tax=Desulforudis sp. DRI-14 TaxID=3459793 RepID=UPI0034963F5A
MFHELAAIGPALSAIATTTLALFTFFTVRASRAMAREMLESRLAQFRPLLYPVLKNDSGKAAVNLRNVGPGPAMDIDIVLTGNFDQMFHIPFLAAGEKIDLPLPGLEFKEGGRVKLRISYKDIFTNQVCVRTWYNLTPVDNDYIIPYETKMDGGAVYVRGFFSRLKKNGTALGK